MHDIISFLKGAVTRGLHSGVLGCYVVRNGAIYASSAALQAGVSMQSEAEFSVPAEELEAFLARCQEVHALDYNGVALVARAGRLRATIQCINGEPPAMPVMPEEWQACPADLPAALKLALPFIGERIPGVRLADHRATVIGNEACIDIAVPGLSLAPVWLTDTAAGFLAEQGAAATYATTENALVFRWDDGRWLRAQHMAEGFQGDVDKILAVGGTDASVEITGHWRAAYADAAALSDGKVTLTPHAIVGDKGGARDVVEIETPVPEGHHSHWSTKFLDPVVACATHWNPAAHPRAALFKGPGLRGVVVGPIS